MSTYFHPHDPSAITIGARCRAGVARGAATVVVTLLVLISTPRSAVAQQSVTDILSFLLTNRSIATGDFAQDEQAAAATRDTISRFLLIELATLPITSSGAGFTYRIDRTLGAAVRSSDSFGPFFVERSLTAGARQFAFGVGYQDTAFDSIDGRDLRDGTLVATAARLGSEAQPFDVETLAVRLRTRTATVAVNVGLADRLDLAAALPIVRLTMSGVRIDTLRGTPFVQATASVSASGMGDVLLRAKYNVLRQRASGVAIGIEMRLPTGDSKNLLGAGEGTFRPRVIGSLELDRLALHGEAGYSFARLSSELNYGAAVTVVAAPRLTLVGELLGRRLESIGRLTETTAPHPRLVGVETIRLSAVQAPTQRVVAVTGVKWNPGATWLVSATILRPVTSAGLTARWVPSAAVEYSFGR